MSDLDAVARTAILAHMNADHGGDNVVIVRAHGVPDAVEAEMVDLDVAAGTWSARSGNGAVSLVRVDWPERLTDRRSAREQIVAVYTAAVGRRGPDGDRGAGVTPGR